MAAGILVCALIGLATLMLWAQEPAALPPVSQQTIAQSSSPASRAPGRTPAPVQTPALGAQTNLPAVKSPAQTTVTGPATSSPPVIPPAPAAGVGFRLQNADLLQFISLVAAQLRINYVVDPAVKGSVTISTAGDLRSTDLLPILQTVLRINGATAIQTGNFYRIIPLTAAPKTPLGVSSDSTGASLPKDDRMIMQIIPLKFVFAADMAKMITPFLSEGGTVAVHEAGNILILVDDSLNVKRLMEILAEFDSSTFADQRVRLFPVSNNVASALVPELEGIFSAYALSEKDTPLRFVALDQINGILVAAADPAAFDEVQKWVEKLDQPAAPSGTQTFVYKVQNSEAAYLVRLLRAIRRGGDVSAVTSPGAAGGASLSTPPAAGFGPNAGGGFGPGANGGLGSGRAGLQSGLQEGIPNQAYQQRAQAALGTGSELGAGLESETETASGLHLVADAVSNSIIFEGTAQQYAEIVNTLKQLDIVPRQALIEARVYEVDLTGNLTFGVEYMLQHRTPGQGQFLGSFTAANALQASVGGIIGSTRELMVFLNADENRSKVRMLSAPTVLATDSTNARIQVGNSVPVLTSQAVVPGVQVASNSVFSNTVTNEDTGVILTVNPRITSTGLVSLTINQEISNEQKVPTTGIQSPSFTKREVSTHAVVRDGQTIALGGLIQYSTNKTWDRIPLLGDIPGLGAIFGSTTYDTTETELIILITPRIITTVPEASAASAEFRDKLKGLERSFKKDKFINPNYRK